MYGVGCLLFQISGHMEAGSSEHLIVVEVDLEARVSWQECEREGVAMGQVQKELAARQDTQGQAA